MLAQALQTDPDTPMRASVPLSPALKLAMKNYLAEVAKRLQAMGFTPARLDRVPQQAHGQSAFRVYYMDFAEPDYARVSYECEAPYRITMQINAARLTDPGARDVITAKGYIDLAHELFHAVQHNSAFSRSNCEPPEWITEGQAEAIGQVAWQIKRARQVDGQVTRWGLRRYDQALDVPPGPDAHDQVYQTSSFWRYLAERAPLASPG